MAKAVIFLVLLFISSAANAATHTVGDTSGWTTSFDYDTWSSGRTFTTGDTLLFNYGFSHALDEVNKADYDRCTTGNPILADSASPTTITLSSTGTRYFICPRSNHCSQGMKLTVTVAAGTTTPSPPATTTPSPPADTTTPSPPATTTHSPPSVTTPSGTPASRTTADAPPTPNGAATGISGGWNCFVIGVSLVLATFLGAMG